MWEDVKVAKGVKILLLQKVKELCPQLATNISKDIHHLNDCNFGKKFITVQCFRKVPKYPVFVFEHSTHIACSSVTYTAVLKGMRQFNNSPGHICCNVKSADMVHHLLQPFFGCNEQVRMVYRSLLLDESTTDEDGERMLTIWKLLLLYFRTTGHTNYIQQRVVTEASALLTDRGVHRLKWCCFINTKGKPGRKFLVTLQWNT